MKEKVLLNKESGELFLKTNITTGALLGFCVLMYNYRYIIEWRDNGFIDLGEL